MTKHRVLIGDFGAVARLGLLELLAGDRLEVVGRLDPPSGPAGAATAGGSGRIVELVNEVRPDVVVLDLDDESALEVAVQITSEFPAIKVVACSCDEPVMQVFPPFHHGESYIAELSRGHLAQALQH